MCANLQASYLWRTDNLGWKTNDPTPLRCCCPLALWANAFPSLENVLWTHGVWKNSSHWKCGAKEQELNPPATHTYPCINSWASRHPLTLRGCSHVDSAAGRCTDQPRQVSDHLAITVNESNDIPVYAPTGMLDLHVRTKTPDTGDENKMWPLGGTLPQNDQLASLGDGYSSGPQLRNQSLLRLKIEEEKLSM